MVRDLLGGWLLEGLPRDELSSHLFTKFGPSAMRLRVHMKVDFQALKPKYKYKTEKLRRFLWTAAL